MHRVLNQFHDNIARVRALGGVYAAIRRITTAALDPSDLLRAQIVMAVSALDHYIHELTLAGMIEIYNGNRPPTPAYLKFQVPLETAVPGIRSTTASWFEAVIRVKHGYLPFQQPDKVADAVRLFSPCELWITVAAVMGTTADDIKSRLRLIVDRRNKIAHEADLDPSYPGSHWPLTESDVASVIDFIQNLCEAIHVSVA
jgi:hypothetical protein